MRCFLNLRNWFQLRPTQIFNRPESTLPADLFGVMAILPSKIAHGRLYRRP